MIELSVPEIGESITEVQVAQWIKQEGEYIRADEPLVELESDKATVELPSPAAGVLHKILIKPGEVAQIGDLLGLLDPDAREETGKATSSQPDSEVLATDKGEPDRITPSARRVLAEQGRTAAEVAGSGKGGMILKEDVQTLATAPEDNAANPKENVAFQEEEILPMSPIRRTIARRLLESQQTTAQLTTFNEADMSAVIELRKRYKESFQLKYGVKLGFMSFFVKAAIEGLKHFPTANAEIRDDSVIFKNYFNIGIAVGGGKGLVVPVIQRAERMSFAEIETTIADYGERGANNRIDLNELTGGTFTISNGGVYGSLMGTPILNPPQSAILGLHAIKDRPVVVDGAIVARPMMNLALTYDHRLVDGRDSVGFLIKIKDVIEDPARLFLEI